jgi:putative PEP-CTERM system TPR-repeat lipoprotein
VTLAPLVDAPDASPEVLALAAQARLLNGEKRAADALYSRLARLKPSDPRLRTILANAGFGKLGDAAVFQELRSIASTDNGTSADLAIISAHLKRKQFDEALQALQTLARKRPEDPMVPQLRGQVMSARNDLPAARLSFEDALRLSPGYFPAVAALAVLDLKQGQPAAARQRFDTLLKTQPKNATAMLALSEVMAREAAPRAAIRKQIEAAIKVAPADMEARLALVNHHLGTGDFDAALGSALTAASALPDNIELLELVARCQLQLRQYGQALASYGKIIGLQPKSPRGHLGAAAVYLATDELDQAQRAIQRALELAPGLPEAQDQAVALALRRQQPARALEIARQMQADRPDSAAGLLEEADIEIRRGNWAAALPPLRRALDKADPGLAARQLHRALLGAGKPAEAESFAAQWLRGHALDTGFLFQLGDTAQAQGNAARAEQLYEAVLAIDPDHALALNNLAMLWLALKKPGARDLAEHAVRLAPDRPALLDTLAQAHASENHLSKAIELQQRVVALAPDDGVTRLTLARYLLESGDKARAKAELEKLAALGAQFGQQAEVSQMLQPLSSSLVKR